MEFVKKYSPLILATGVMTLSGCSFLGFKQDKPTPEPPAAPASTAAAQPAAQPPSLPPSTESLLTPMPRGYVIGFETRANGMHMMQMVPEGQSTKNWLEMVTTQVMQGSPLTLEQYNASIQSLWAEGCPKGGKSTPAKNLMVNGYPAQTWQATCALNQQTNRPESTAFLSVRGASDFYVVQVTAKTKPSKKWSAQTQAYLKMVTVCDARNHAHPCPNVAMTQR